MPSDFVQYTLLVLAFAALIVLAKVASQQNDDRNQQRTQKRSPLPIARRFGRSLQTRVTSLYRAIIGAEPQALVVPGAAAVVVLTIWSFNRFQAFGSNFAATIIGSLLDGFVVGLVLRYGQDRGERRRWSQVRVYLHRGIGLRIAAVVNAFARQPELTQRDIRSMPLIRALSTVRASVEELSDDAFRKMTENLRGDQLRATVLLSIAEVERLAVIQPSSSVADPALLGRVTDLTQSALAWRYWSDTGTPKGAVGWDAAWRIAAGMLSSVFRALLAVAEALDYPGLETPLDQLVDLSQLDIP